MNYKTILRLGSTVVNTVEPDDESTYLSDDEVMYIMAELARYEELYFEDIPLSRNLQNTKKFIYNIPRNVYKLIRRNIDNDENELLSPLFILYPLLVDDMSNDTQIMYLSKLGEFINSFFTEGDVDDE